MPKIEQITSIVSGIKAMFRPKKVTHIVAPFQKMLEELRIKEAAEKKRLEDLKGASDSVEALRVESVETINAKKAAKVEKAAQQAAKGVSKVNKTAQDAQWELFNQKTDAENEVAHAQCFITKLEAFFDE